LNGTDASGIKQYKGEPALTSDVVRCLLQDREGNIWAGTQNGLNKLSESVVVSVPEPNDGMGRLVHAVAAGAGGAMWVGTGDGLYEFSGTSRRRYDWRHGLPRESIQALHRDASDRIWVATSNRLGQFYDHQFHQALLPPGVQLGRVSAITTDHNHDLWICDFDRGLTHLHDGQVVTLEDASPKSKTCFIVLADSSRRVWVGFL